MRKRFNKKSYLLILLVSVLAITTLTIGILGVTGAWFTARNSKDSTVSTATVTATAWRNGASIDTESPIVLPVSSAGTNLLAPNAIQAKNTSTIPAYLRAVITINWVENEGTNEDIFSVLTFALNSDWMSSKLYNNSSPTDNQKVSSLFIYYNKPVAANTAVDMINSLTVDAKKTMPCNAILSVEIEAVQADNIGKARLQDTDSYLTAEAWTAIFGA